MRISDWSSDVCSSDLIPAHPLVQAKLGAVPELQHVRLDHEAAPMRRPGHLAAVELLLVACHPLLERVAIRQGLRLDRKSVVAGKSVSVRVDPGGRRIMTKKKKTKRKNPTT